MYKSSELRNTTDFSTYMIYEYFRATGAHETVQIISTILEGLYKSKLE